MKRKQVIGNGQRRRSRAEAEQLVDVFEVSGLRRREEQGPVASDTARTQNEAARARLVAVELAGTANSSRLAVVLSRGRRVEVSEGFDVATLERLLAVLEQA